MITLEQIQLLEQKVHQAVKKIAVLKEENAGLKEKLSSYSGRIEELEVLIDSFKRDQGKIEEGILSAIRQLDTIEQSVASEAANPSSTSPADMATVDASSEDSAPVDTPAPAPEEAEAAESIVEADNDLELLADDSEEKSLLGEDEESDRPGESPSREAELDIF